jgi:hypothetical protein
MIESGHKSPSEKSAEATPTPLGMEAQPAIFRVGTKECSTCTCSKTIPHFCGRSIADFLF